ncbi:truncated putative DD41D transposase [Trichonephila clavipes]|nr:truncated putative DD41D transposase [Trichonephila clavipes]
MDSYNPKFASDFFPLKPNPEQNLNLKQVEKKSLVMFSNPPAAFKTKQPHSHQASQRQANQRLHLGRDEVSDWLDAQCLTLTTLVAAVAEWYRYRTVACFVTGSSPVPLKTHRVGQRCTLNLSRAETSSRSCQVIYSQFGLAINQNDHQARHRFVEWVQNEIAVVPDFHKRILFRDEAHFWLNGNVNKQNCHIWSEANPQVYVETPLHPEKLTVWCALWAGGIIGSYFFKNDEGHNVTVNVIGIEP